MSIRQLIRKYFWPVINIRRHGRYNVSDKVLEKKYKSEIDSIHKFYLEYNDFRLVDACSKVTNLDIKLCKRVKEYLYKKRIIGNYIFEDNKPPHKYMREFILSKYPQINFNSSILEVGPGNFPIFQHTEYRNWYAIDKYFDIDRINFRNLNWAVNQYPTDKICKGTWETLYDSTRSLNINEGFDLVVSSHSYEHCFKPIASLIEASKVLKKDGIIVLFVPDGFSDHPSARSEMTHTLYLVPDMIEEFFKYANVFSDLQIISFRPNADFAIIAKKS
jgi:SAM-dependent methyltransferase